MNKEEKEKLTRLEKRILPLLSEPEVTMKVIKEMPYKNKESLYHVLYEKYHGDKPS
tara:strand:+ start:1245 stop:1412 length:168 start_codon:yes stop_codon:yes gene_type:complete